MPVKLKSPPTSRFQVGGTSALQAWLPAKLKSPPLQAQVRGGSRLADLAVVDCQLSYKLFHDNIINLYISLISNILRLCVCLFCI